MTLENCRLRLKVAQTRINTKTRKLIVDPVEVKFWEDRIAHRLTLPKYASEVKEKSHAKKN